MNALFFIFSLLLFSCSSAPQLAKVHLTTQKGLTQTVTEKERLKPFTEDSFLRHQPHQKVVRVFEKPGETTSLITTYHPTNQIYQLLECKNNQACGSYKEWSPAGHLMVEARVIGGSPEIDPTGNPSWIFDGASRAYDEEGNLCALFHYINGLLEGDAASYYSSGNVKQKLFYQGGKRHGTQLTFAEDQTLLEKTNYTQGLHDGTSYKYWSKVLLQSEEKYKKGLLEHGLYFDERGKLIARIHNGSGCRCDWEEDKSYTLTSYCEGVPQGLIQAFDASHHLKSSYHLKDGIKTGPEVHYYTNSSQPKLSLEWRKGLVHGSIKTWYLSGELESEREMCQNKKHGLFKAHYKTGALMFLEEYQEDLLVKGQYFKLGSLTPSSEVKAGEGVATLYDCNGLLVKRVEYLGGKPLD